MNKKTFWFASGVMLIAAMTSTAQAATMLLASRLVATDVPALAKFYETVFDMKQVNRFDMQNGMMEIMLNFGGTVDAAKANRAATQVVISSKSPDSGLDKVAHLVFQVDDFAGTVKKFKAAGGKFDKEPQTMSGSKNQIALGTDPIGNQIEILWLEPKK